MRKNKPAQAVLFKRMCIVYTIFCAVVTAAAIMCVNIAQRKANDEIRQYHEQAVREIVKANNWATGEYPQWFIEWLNTEFYGTEAEE